MTLTTWWRALRESVWPSLERAPAAVEPYPPQPVIEPHLLERADAERARQAMALVSSPSWQAAHDDLERTYIAAWIDTPAQDVETRERLWLALHSARTMRANLAALISRRERLRDDELPRAARVSVSSLGSSKR